MKNKTPKNSNWTRNQSLKKGFVVAKARKYQFLEVFCENIITSNRRIEREG
jgi:hypothetical protein